MKRHDLLLCLILALFLLFGVSIALQQRTIWWDSAVYGGMGKHYWSWGESGFTEPSRPPLLPLLLGAFWKLGMDVPLWGSILAMLFSLGTIYLTFRIGEMLFHPNAGLLAAFFTGFAFTFLSSSHRMLTEIPSSFFLLLGVILLTGNRPFAGGAALAASFLMKFFQLLPILIVVAIYFILWHRKEQKNRWPFFLKTAAGFFTSLLPYFLFIVLAYGNVVLPFALQFYLSAHTGIIYSQPWWFYLTGMVQDNPFILLVLGLPFLCGKKGNHHLLLIAGTALIPLLLYSFIAHKEMRLLLPLLPFFSLMAAFCMTALFECIAHRPLQARIWLFILCGIFFGISMLRVLPLLMHPSNPAPAQEKFFQEYLSQPGFYGQSVWISNPTYALFSDVPISGLVYYPLLKGESGIADIALINTCDFSGNDEEYSRIIQYNFGAVTAQLKPAYSSQEKGCTYTIYRK